jgi:uncharacterized protein (DUF1800 family)
LNIDINQVLLRERYAAGKYRDGREYPAVDEMRPLGLLNASIPTLFQYTGKDELLPQPERSRPRKEIQAATLIRAIQAKSYWEEEWIAFWRDHFSVYGYEQNVGAFLPHWESEVIRKNAFGNFRQMLEATATHPCMLYYLNNKSSRAGSANENYARELFELHTLGRQAYLNNLYAQWREVPGALQGKPKGYIDQDVYEAARAFTGWTIEDGTGIGGGQNLPKTGQFIYLESWHDNYQKRILATEFDPYSGPMKDGKRVLDLCAFHPATAHHLMRKLIKRMIQDDPSEKMIQSAQAVFIEHRNSPNQLSLLSKHIAKLAASLPKKERQKVKKPMRLAATFINAVNLPFDFSEGKIMGQIESAGPALYGWVSPEGPPDGLQWNLSAGYLRQRFVLIQGLAENWWGTGEWNPFSNLPANPSYSQLLSRWETPLFGEPRPELSQALIRSQGLTGSDRIGDIKVARRMVGYLACSPSFQTEAIEPDFSAGGQA